MMFWQIEVCSRLNTHTHTHRISNWNWQKLRSAVLDCDAVCEVSHFVHMLPWNKDGTFIRAHILNFFVKSKLKIEAKNSACDLSCLFRHKSYSFSRLARYKCRKECIPAPLLSVSLCIILACFSRFYSHSKVPRSPQFRAHNIYVHL